VNHKVVNERDTQILGQKFSNKLVASNQWPRVVYLTGDLGAGKSVFARSILQSMGVNEVIKSPTYTLVEQYSTQSDLHAAHLDLYRLNDPEELYYIGFDDIALTCDLMLIEWPEKGQGLLPKPTHDVIIEYLTGGRSITITEHA